MPHRLRQCGSLAFVCVALWAITPRRSCRGPADCACRRWRTRAGQDGRRQTAAWRSVAPGVRATRQGWQSSGRAGFFLRKLHGAVPAKKSVAARIASRARSCKISRSRERPPRGALSSTQRIRSCSMFPTGNAFRSGCPVPCCASSLSTRGRAIVSPHSIPIVMAISSGYAPSRARRTKSP